MFDNCITGPGEAQYRGQALVVVYLVYLQTTSTPIRLPVLLFKMKSSKFEDFKLFLWDPQTRKSLGRTGDSWAKLIGFYIVLYSCLAAIWSIYFYIFHLTISEKYPKWQLEESIIGTNPGVGHRPQSPRQRVESALIAFREGPDGDYEHWVEDLNVFLERGCRLYAISR